LWVQSPATHASNFSTPDCKKINKPLWIRVLVIFSDHKLIWWDSIKVLIAHQRSLSLYCTRLLLLLYKKFIDAMYHLFYFRLTWAFPKVEVGQKYLYIWSPFQLCFHFMSHCQIQRIQQVSELLFFQAKLLYLYVLQAICITFWSQIKFLKLYSFSQNNFIRL